MQPVGGDDLANLAATLGLVALAVSAGAAAVATAQAVQWVMRRLRG